MYIVRPILTRTLIRRSMTGDFVDRERFGALTRLGIDAYASGIAVIGN